MEQESLFDLGPDWAGFDKDARTVLGRSGADEEGQPPLRVAGASPERVVSPDSVARVSGVMEAIGRRGLCLVPLGLGAHAAAAGPPDRPFVALSLSRLDRIVDFQPANMTMTVESGVTLAQLQAHAARSGQWLPVDPPLESVTTAGGLIAANLSGPTRFSQGTVRDLLVGLKVVMADGTVVHGGGRVVKNVTGYDLPKLYCGSEGTLGIIVEATFKLRPRPDDFKILQVRCQTLHRTQELLTRCLLSGFEPSFVELLSFVPLGDLGYNIIVGCFGPAEQVAYQVQQIGALMDGEAPQELSDQDAHRAVRELRDFRASGKNALRVKVSLLPTKVMPFVRRLEAEGKAGGTRIALQAHAGNGIVYANIREVPGGDEAERTLSGLVDRLHRWAGELNGSLRLLDAPPELLRVRGPTDASAASAALGKKIKDKLDPRNLLSPGRSLY